MSDEATRKWAFETARGLIGTDTPDRPAVILQLAGKIAAFVEAANGARAPQLLAVGDSVSVRMAGGDRWAAGWSLTSREAAEAEDDPLAELAAEVLAEARAHDEAGHSMPTIVGFVDGSRDDVIYSVADALRWLVDRERQP